jgi:hypothetical protein
LLPQFSLLRALLIACANRELTYKECGNIACQDGLDIQRKWLRKLDFASRCSKGSMSLRDQLIPFNVLGGD